MKEIPTVLDTYEESDVGVKTFKHGEAFEYEVAKGEIVLVHKWVRFPSYDFIFGTPRKDSPRYKEEFGFFAFRRKENGVYRGWSIYVDQTELKEMVSGFMRIIECSECIRAPEWKEYNKTKNEVRTDS